MTTTTTARAAREARALAIVREDSAFAAAQAAYTSAVAAAREAYAAIAAKATRDIGPK